MKKIKKYLVSRFTSAKVWVCETPNFTTKPMSYKECKKIHFDRGGRMYVDKDAIEDIVQ